jgi:hypothetical protein
MFQAIICSSSGGTVYKTIFFVRVMSAGCSQHKKNIPTLVSTVPPDDEQISARNM